MAKAKKLPSGNYRALVYVGKDAAGKRLYESFTDPNKDKVELMASEFRVKRKRKDRPEEMTVGQAIDRYIELKEVVLSPSTIRGYKQIKGKYLESIMCVSFKRLTNEKIQIAFNKEIKRNLSTKTLRNILGLLSAALRQYHSDFEIKVTLPKKQHVNANIPSDSDMEKLISISTNTEMIIPILLASCLGLRRGEICALKWSDIDFKKNDASINSSKVINSEKKWEIKSPKSYAGNRTIHMPPMLTKILSENKNNSDFVVNMSPNALSCRFVRLLKKNNLPHFRFHDLRHFNASVMLALNIPDKYAMERMGHATNSTLKTVYQHTMKDKKESIDDSINRYFEQLMQHEMQHTKE